jgi:hypothetical protein
MLNRRDRVVAVITGVIVFVFSHLMMSWSAALLFTLIVGSVLACLAACAVDAILSPCENSPKAWSAEDAPGDSLLTEDDERMLDSMSQVGPEGRVARKAFQQRLL